MENFAATQRKACELAHIARSTFGIGRHREGQTAKKKLQSWHRRSRDTATAAWESCWGEKEKYVNHKRLFRVYRAAGLSVRRKKRKRLVRVGQPLFATATQPTMGDRLRP